MIRLFLVAGLAAAGPALAQNVAQPGPGLLTVPLPVTGEKVHAAGAGSRDGHALFAEKCAMCHGPGGMGTALLARRMDPKIAELEKRTDLSPDYIAMAVRQGIGNMPWLSRGEVSDAQLAAIAGYLAKGIR